MVLVCEIDTVELLRCVGVMLVELATAKEVRMHHALDEQENHDRQEHYEQEHRECNPWWIRFFRIYLVPIGCHLSCLSALNFTAVQGH